MHDIVDYVPLALREFFRNSNFGIVLKLLLERIKLCLVLLIVSHLFLIFKHHLTDSEIKNEKVANDYASYEVEPRQNL
jgi:hypothetical protein